MTGSSSAHRAGGVDVVVVGTRPAARTTEESMTTEIEPN